MRALDVALTWGEDEIAVGTLVERNRAIYFEYDAAFLANPLPLSPFKLAVKAGLVEHTDRDFAGVFGVFNDSLPDGWGLLLMDREFRKQGLNPAAVSPLDRLAYIGTRGMGALTYHPPTAADDDERLGVDLDAIARQAERILEGSAEDVLPALRIAGGSPAGARPKVLVGVADDGRLLAGTADLPPGYRHYLVKFNAREDAPDIGAVEVAYSAMAREAGVDVPAARLFETRDGGRYFGAERFDRAGNERIHMHTLSGLLHASHRVPSMDYEGFLRATHVLTQHARELEEAFRRMVFNVLAHNRDDHVKNFSYLMGREGQWRLAPAYDLVFSDGPRGEHTMAVAGEARRPSVRDMLRVAEAASVDAGRARQIIEQVRDAVSRWPHFARETGVPDGRIQEIGRVLATLGR
ncbi:type II toxin-antitoxin system HipA family toxin [Longimicrobium sp.]|uniref:type II toxin-antitoxin system HipA family toxin n=1 Tax=Longimicrobium sp. TaxID=2029185 RepID=UPI002E31CA89|nr:type II toxin-antitoxin system HipA family toxin [Longimicrobium sp.]HEX6041153.1 type II toxin-antitoxin system HipA family toxin [Longimicrobium sp.]